MILLLFGITIGRRAADGMALYNALGVVKLTAGILIGLVTLVLLAGREAETEASSVLRSFP